MSDEPEPQGDDAGAVAGWVVPRLLVFYRDVIEEGTPVAHLPVRWGVRLPNGHIAAWPVTPPFPVTIYDDLDTAAYVLGAWPHTIDHDDVMWWNGEFILTADAAGSNTVRPAAEGRQAGGG
jgi:hypothetical protein